MDVTIPLILYIYIYTSEQFFENWIFVNISIYYYYYYTPTHTPTHTHTHTHAHSHTHLNTNTHTHTHANLRPVHFQRRHVHIVYEDDGFLTHRRSEEPFPSLVQTRHDNELRATQLIGK